MDIEFSQKMASRNDIKKQIELNKSHRDRYYLGDKKWASYGEDISSYENTFGGVLSGPILDLLKDKEDPVVIDIMSPPHAIRSLFSKIPDQRKLGIAISLEDLRLECDKESDAISNIFQVAGDIMHDSTWGKIEKTLNGRKANLIMERAILGLDCISYNVPLYIKLLNRVWRLLDKNGIFIAEIPYQMSDRDRMLRWFRKNNLPDVEIESSLKSRSQALVLRINRKPDSPFFLDMTLPH